MQNNSKNIKDKISEMINNGDINIKPKFYYILKTILLIIATIFIFIFAIFLASFVYFYFKISLLWALPILGFAGVKAMILYLPWVLILILLAIIVILEFVAEQFSFVYKKPLLYSLFAIIIIIFITASLISYGKMHENFYITANNRNQLVKYLYADVAEPKMPNIHNGRVIEIIQKDLLMENRRGDKILVKPLFELKRDIVKDDFVIVVGKRIGNVIEALDIKRVNQNSNFFDKNMMRKNIMK